MSEKKRGTALWTFRSRCLRRPGPGTAKKPLFPRGAKGVYGKDGGDASRGRAAVQVAGWSLGPLLPTSWAEGEKPRKKGREGAGTRGLPAF